MQVMLGLQGPAVTGEDAIDRPSKRSRTNNAGEAWSVYAVHSRLVICAVSRSNSQSIAGGDPHALRLS